MMLPNMPAETSHHITPDLPSPLLTANEDGRVSLLTTSRVSGALLRGDTLTSSFDGNLAISKRITVNSLRNQRIAVIHPAISPASQTSDDEVQHQKSIATFIAQDGGQEVGQSPSQRRR